MSVSEESAQSSVHDFGKILSHRVDGKLPLVVGGQAVNLWATIYRSALACQLTPDLLPLTSKDLDLAGSLDLLEELQRVHGGTKILARDVRSPVVGQLLLQLNGGRRRIEVLRSVYGLDTKDLDERWLEVAFDGHRSRVPTPLALLQAKLAGAAHLAQDGRNDVKHVRIMLLVVREFLSQLLRLSETGDINPRDAVNALEEARKIVRSSDALKCATCYQLDLNRIWPYGILEETKDAKIRNFATHRLPPGESK